MTASPEPGRLGRAHVLVNALLAALLLLVVVSVAVRSYRMEGSSMLPNLEPGERVLVDRLSYGRVGDSYLFRSPQRGEVVIFRSPEDPGILLVKRVIGVPGDVVEISAGRVSVNGEPLRERYLDPETTTSYAYLQTTWEVPPGHLFVLGDNRSDSTDSRNWGFLAAEDVAGRAISAG